MTDACTTAALAALIGIQVYTINDFAKREILVRAGGGRYIRDESVRRYCAHLRELAHGRGGMVRRLENGAGWRARRAEPLRAKASAFIGT